MFVLIYLLFIATMFLSLAGLLFLPPYLFPDISFGHPLSVWPKVIFVCYLIFSVLLSIRIAGWVVEDGIDKITIIFNKKIKK